jgi:formylmethanofuran dehydrogenase subunit E
MDIGYWRTEEEETNMSNNPLPGWYEGKKKECDRCGFIFPLSRLITQNGLQLCPDCLDEEE